MESVPIVEVKEVTKTYGGAQALRGVSLAIKPGEIHALIGENGAGKSTLIKILTGVVMPDRGGSVHVSGTVIDDWTPIHAIRAGIAAIYQDFSLFSNLSVVENVCFGLSRERKTPIVNWREMRAIARGALGRLGVPIPLDARLGDLSIAKQQLVAIARAFAFDARLIIMDEPTSALGRSDVETLFEIMRALRNEGISFLFVSHKIDELYEIAETFTILRDGSGMGTYSAQDLSPAELISLMVGREIEYVVYPKQRRSEPLMLVDSLTKRGNYADISFQLHCGEVLGITGLVGSGRSELMQSLCGVETPDSGTIVLDGTPVRITSPAKAASLGISYVPEDRLSEGLVLKKSVMENVLVANRTKVEKRFGLRDKAAERNLVDHWINLLNVKPPRPEMIARSLSGGNQQKVVVAKCLAGEPRILMVDEPTNGIDIGAKTELHKLIRTLASNGISILLISSELPEVLAVADRIIVMKRGRIAGIFDAEDATQESLMSAALLGATA